MNFFKLIICITSYFALTLALADQDDGNAATTTATTTSATYVWITTTVGGQLVTISVPYSQSFMTTYTAADTDAVESGSVGLGSISGSLGGIRTYSQTTITNSNEAPSFLNLNGLYSGVIGGMIVLLGLL